MMKGTRRRLSTLLTVTFYVTNVSWTTEAAPDPDEFHKKVQVLASETKGAAMSAPLLQSDVPGWPCRRGKVRGVYDLGDRLAIVATDRISAFDWILPTGIPNKGSVLTALSLFWFDFLKVPNHLLSTDLAALGPAFAARREELEGRSCLVKKTTVVPIECVVRGYLVGTGWK